MSVHAKLLLLVVLTQCCAGGARMRGRYCKCWCCWCSCGAPVAGVRYAGCAGTHVASAAGDAVSVVACAVAVAVDLP
eukprot:6871366-Alexandrium_andersonii.AAC.1